jgi:AcrR family transcriptional regulator
MNQKEIKEKLFIVSSFMDSTLLNENYPMSVYNFCKKNDIEEKTFYKYFGSFDAVKKMIWQSFYDNAISLLEKDKDFRDSSPKEKLLSFYYTFFEILLLNRSYILFVLSKEEKILNKISDLKTLRINCLSFGWMIRLNLLKRQIKQLRNLFKQLLMFLKTHLCLH